MLANARERAQRHSTIIIVNDFWFFVVVVVPVRFRIFADATSANITSQFPMCNQEPDQPPHDAESEWRRGNCVRQ